MRQQQPPPTGRDQTTDDGASLWPRLAKLRLVVEGCELERLEADRSFGFDRVTTQIRLLGEGTDGLGEDISPMAGDEHDALHVAGPSLSLDGEWTLERFCDYLATVEQWSAPPKWEAARLYRNWAYESAALDLALRQAGRALHDVLELRPWPVRFVNSLGLGDQPSIRTIGDRLARYPGLRFKLDAVPAWSAEMMAELAMTRAVESIDLKGQYGFEIDDVEVLGAFYDRVLAAFPDALLEDPHDVPEITARLAPHVARISYDAPIHSARDLGTTTLPARSVNVKPSRVGGLRPLLDLYAHCRAAGVQMYGGGMGELGIGRGQIQLLASLFHADGPNDVAPVGYNAVDARDGLPSSPLAPRPAATGFRWATEPQRQPEAE
jgi:L-alanine-DL-glutamate epimerase-like enolase superfamily enzyme